jgi:thiol:disulfide interchange protein
MYALLLLLIGLCLLAVGFFLGKLWSTEPPLEGRWVYHLRRTVGLIVATAGIGFLLSAPGASIGSVGGKEKLTWGHDLEAALAQGKAEKRPVIVDAWATWCASCRRLADETFEDPRVVKSLNGFVRVKLDMDKPENEAVWERFSIKGLPWVGFFTSDGKLNEGLILTDFEAADPFLARLAGVEKLKAKKNVVAGWIEKRGIALALLLVFFAGVAASFTPCVYPLIPIVLGVIGTTVAGSGKGSRGRAFTLSLTFTGALVITYAALGSIVAVTDSAVGKDTMQNPWVVGAVAAVFFLLALSMLGLFTIQLPASLQQKLASRQQEMADQRDKGKAAGYGLAAFSGFVSALVAAPCVGPVLVAILAYAAQLGDPVAAFGLMMVFGCGFGLLFVVLGTFSGLLKKVPRSGPWMERVKVGFALAFTVVAMVTIAGVTPELARIPERAVEAVLR